MALAEWWQIAIGSVCFAMVWFTMAFPTFKWAPLGRQVGPALPSVFMVLTGVLSAEDAYHAIELPTLVFLLGIMIVVVVLEEQGVVASLKRTIGNTSSPRYLLFRVTLVSAVLSAIITNDGVCILFTPIVIDLCREKNLIPLPFLVALSTSANIGSIATQTGNPQNVLIGHLSGVSWNNHFKLSIWVAIVAYICNVICLLLFYQKLVDPTADTNNDGTSLVDNENAGIAGEVTLDKFDRENTPEARATPHIDISQPHPSGLTPFQQKTEKIVTVIVLLALQGVLAAGADIGWAVMMASLIPVGLRTVFSQKPESVTQIIERVDWNILFFFGALFVGVVGFAATGLPDALWDLVAEFLDGNKWLGVSMLIGFVETFSNAFSNVPVVLLVADIIEFELTWVLVAWVSTIAGNLTLVGSAANIIVASMAQVRNIEYSFYDHFVFGFWTTIVFTFICFGVYVATAVMYGYELVWLSSNVGYDE